VAADQVGTPRVISDATGNIIKTLDYDSYGVLLADNNLGFDLPIGFSGGISDRVTGLVRFGVRDYDPAIGRWTAKDPILFAGGDSNPYRYVFNDPVSYVDRKGESPQNESKNSEYLEKKRMKWDDYYFKGLNSISASDRLAINLDSERRHGWREPDPGEWLKECARRTYYKERNVEKKERDFYPDDPPTPPTWDQPSPVKFIYFGGDSPITRTVMHEFVIRE
jgi:RHS repeat-associated protein